MVAGIVAMVCWIVTKETFRLDAENLQRKLDNLHFFVRESSRLKRLVQALCLIQFVIWLECGGEAFEYWLDKFLCILLLLAALLAEVLSGLYLRPGTTCWRNSNINVPSLNKPNWLWWLVHMFAFEVRVSWYMEGLVFCPFYDKS